VKPPVRKRPEPSLPFQYDSADNRRSSKVAMAALDGAAIARTAIQIAGRKPGAR
jgi:hypothetical protein